VWYLSPSTDSTLLVPPGSWWRYLDDGSDRGESWRFVDFDDSLWKQGQAELGYGDAEAGQPETTIIDYGIDPNNKPITYYFRHSFVVDDPAAYSALVLALKRDDGGMVYLNGAPVFTSNLPAGPVDYLTRAMLAEDDGAQFHAAAVEVSALRSGTNVVAVEIHQESPGSSDVSFDLSLEAERMPRLQWMSFGNEWFLVWSTPGFVLEWAEGLDGIWSVSEATSPAPVIMGAGERFYRLRAADVP
jgi:hypothetical protein